jgi:hypothetical protein
MFRGTTIAVRSKWSISLNDIIKKQSPAAIKDVPSRSNNNSFATPNAKEESQHSRRNDGASPDEDDETSVQPPPPPPSKERHKVLDVSTYHGWDSMDAQDTSIHEDDEDGIDGVISKKEVVEWDPVRKMVVKKVVTSIVTPNQSGTTRNASIDVDSFSYDGTNMKQKMSQAQKKAMVKAAQKDPTSPLCKTCPICLKRFAGHPSMISHLLYRDKCYFELDVSMRDHLIKQKILHQQKRLRHKLRKKHLPTYENDRYDILKIDIRTGENIDPNRDLRFRLKKDAPDSERSRIYKEKMRLINEKYATATATTISNATTGTDTTTLTTIAYTDTVTDDDISSNSPIISTSTATATASALSTDAKNEM